MKQMLKVIALTKIILGENVRLPHLLSVEELAQDIRQNGLKTPPAVWHPDKSKDEFEVLQGHRRILACRELSSRYPDKFKELFPKGITIIVHEGIEQAEALELKVDHGNELSLSDPMEIQLCSNLLFSANKTEAEVANSLANLIGRIKAMNSKTKAKCAELEQKAIEAEKTGDKAKAAGLRAEAYQKVAEYYRGRVQHLHDVYRCPPIVMESLYFKATGIRREGFEKKNLLNLTQSHINRLWKAFREDMEIKGEDNLPKFSRIIPGPNFSAKWRELEEDELKRAEEMPTAKKKAMSRKDMEAENADGTWLSKGFQKLTQHHSGDKDVVGLPEHDKMLWQTEVLAERDPSAYTEIKKMVEGYIAESVEMTEAANQEVNA